MNKAFSLLRKFPMAIAMTIFILVVSLIPIPETPLSGITLIDKWTHIGLYT
ncbi:MAG: antibiotic resistance protein VanZ, partial [Prevotella pallens]|nr:antibiotic resistance protein VanZ [Prevotella pallens]